MAIEISQPKGPSRPRNLPDRIADELITRILVGELRPGAVLPAERTLARELAVDRTSLRMALRQLTRMKLVRTLRGSGITVLDYRRHAGLDFLAAVLDSPGVFLGGAFLLEALDHYVTAMPAVVEKAFRRATPADVRELDAMFTEQLRLLDEGASLDTLQQIELDVQDAIFAMCGDVTLQLIANSTRELRRTLGLKLMELTDVRAQIETQRALVRAALADGDDVRGDHEAHRQYMAAHHRELRRYLASLPPGPLRILPWNKEAA